MSDSPTPSAVSLRATPAIVIRQGTAADAAALTAFAGRLFRDVFGPDNRESDMAQYTAAAFNAEMQTRELTEPGRVVLLGESDGALACYALLRTGPADECVTGADPVEIERFYVDFPWHGTGAAAQLMDHVIDTAKALGGHTLWLGVWEHNPRAIRFYQKLGFVDVGAHPFTLGEDLQTDRVMTRPLP